MNKYLMLIFNIETATTHVVLADICLKDSIAQNPAQYAASGEEAIQYLKRTGKYTGESGAEDPADILLDLRLPNDDSFELLETLRADKTLMDIPVIIFNPPDLENDISRSVQNQDNFYLVQAGSFNNSKMR